MYQYQSQSKFCFESAEDDRTTRERKGEKGSEHEGGR